MNDWMREVDYATYCPKCKNFNVLETDEPCNECLTECAREGSKKPVKFEEKRENNKFLYEVNSYLKGDICYEKSIEGYCKNGMYVRCRSITAV